MPTDTPSRQSLLRYLLNELSESEREQIDTLLIADPDYAARFQELEYDLSDALASGELTGAEEQRARRALSERGPLPLSVRRSEAPRKPTVLRPQAILWLALAALLLVAIALEISAHRPATQSPTQASLTPPAAAPGQPPSQPPSLPIVASLLLPGAARSATALKFRIPHQADTVEITWPTPPEAKTRTRYRLQWLTDRGTLTCSDTGKPQGTLQRFQCPAHSIPQGTDFVRISELPSAPDDPALLELTIAVEKP